MSKFKVGDRVKLRNDLRVGRCYGKIRFLSNMQALQDKELTIYDISPQGNYTFEESNYYCSEEMLEKLFNDSDLLKFALDKFNITKEELIKEYKEDIKKY